MSKYILHYGSIAGISFYNALALRKLGQDSINVIPSATDYGGTDVRKFNRQLPFDKALYEKTSNPLYKLVQKSSLTLRTLVNCNLVHFYSESILKNFDSLLFQQARIPMIITWAGGDARIISLAREKNPYFYREPDDARDRATRNRLEAIAKYVHYVATDPELGEQSRTFFDKVFIVPQPIDLDEITCAYPQKGNERPLVLHIPTHRNVKGTIHIGAAVERLKAEGLSFEFKSIEPTLTQKQVRQLLSTADVYVDELRCGSYGITAVESMASGKPTITYIRDDLIEKYHPDLPIVNANPDTIYQKLKELIKDAEWRYELGIKSRQYVERYHAVDSVGIRLMQVYREIGLQD